MFKIRVNNKYAFEVDKTHVNGEIISADIHQINSTIFHVLHKHQSHQVEVVEFNKIEKTCTIKVNTNNYILDMKDQYDDLLHSLGMDNLDKVKVTELKAPMPGLVLKVLANEGDEVKQGDNILVLEAMKMENIIKSPADGIIKSIRIKPSDKVEKNQVMIVFE